MPRLLTLPLACLVLLAAGCGSSNEKTAEATATETATAAATESPAATATPAETATPESTPTPEPDFSNGCDVVKQPKVKDPAPELKKPTEKLVTNETYIATVTTNCGKFNIQLDPDHAPITGGSFKYLADKKFYDGLTFHRIVPSFVIQGGDPGGDGAGGPGYSVVEAPPEDLEYAKGVVAMAKTQDEAPGTSGSQFFVVSGDGAAELPPEYALVGVVADGIEVVEKIGGIQADASGRPAIPVVIKSIRVKVK